MTMLGMFTIEKHIKGPYNKLSYALFTNRSFQQVQEPPLWFEEKMIHLNSNLLMCLMGVFPFV